MPEIPATRTYFCWKDLKSMNLLGWLYPGPSMPKWNTVHKLRAIATINQCCWTMWCHIIHQLEFSSLWRWTLLDRIMKTPTTCTNTTFTVDLKLRGLHIQPYIQKNILLKPLNTPNSLWLWVVLHSSWMQLVNCAACLFGDLISTDGSLHSTNLWKCRKFGEIVNQSWVRTVYSIYRNEHGAECRGKEREGEDDRAYVGVGGRVKKNLEHECYSSPWLLSTQNMTYFDKTSDFIQDCYCAQCLCATQIFSGTSGQLLPADRSIEYHTEIPEAKMSRNLPTKS